MPTIQTVLDKTWRNPFYGEELKSCSNLQQHCYLVCVVPNRCMQVQNTRAKPKPAELLRDALFA